MFSLMLGDNPNPNAMYGKAFSATIGGFVIYLTSLIGLREQITISSRAPKTEIMRLSRIGNGYDSSFSLRTIDAVHLSLLLKRHFALTEYPRKLFFVNSIYITGP